MRQHDGWPALAPISEVLLLAVTLSALGGLGRIFIGTDWLAPLAVHAVAAHLTVAVLRRGGLSTPAAAAATAVVGLVTISAVHLGEFTRYGIPTRDTLDVAFTRMGDAFSQFAEVKAPIEPLDGFLIATAAAVWAGAVLADWAAFRVHAVIEPVLPAATLFTIGAIFGADRGRIPAAAAWSVAVLAFVLLRRADRLGRVARWVGDRTGRGPRTLVGVGTALIVAAVGVAVVVGPRLPGAEAEALVSLTDLGDDGPGTRVTVSPLVDIRSRLVDQADVEVFRVRSDVRSYWRLTSLDTFDGRIWSSNGSYGKTSGRLDDGVPVASERVVATQTFQIGALSQIWLPAAYEPRQVTVDRPVRYDEVSGTLIVDADLPTSNGATYGVVSLLPVHQPGQLQAATNVVPADVAERYTGVPAELPPVVAEMARLVTAEAFTAFDAARALQDFFRAEFTYSLEVFAGHDGSAIERFLTETRAGYCEQFAGTFAAMARTLGIPARVAVGFTPGTADADDPGLFRVRGEHAHAWPEVYLGEFGWVAFEPTPGRGAPLAEQYTGVPEQQAESANPTVATTTPLPATIPTTTPPGVSIPVTDVGSDFGVGTGGEVASEPSRWWLWLLGVVAGIVLAVGSYAVVVVGVAAARRNSRRRAATTASAQVSLAWDESLRSLRARGVDIPTTSTQRQAASAAGSQFPPAAAAVDALAAVVENAAYAPAHPEPDIGTAALTHADEVDAVVQASFTPSQRWRRRLDPRRLRD